MDANFANQLKIKTKVDPDDLSLFDGRCFYPAEAEFQKYLAEVSNPDEVRLLNPTSRSEKLLFTEKRLL